MFSFHLLREIDDSGISGTGVVAEGVEFSDGVCVLRWMTEISSTVMYQSIEDVKRIHGHHGHTKIVWEDDQD